jgi:hypothetical protein
VRTSDVTATLHSDRDSGWDGGMLFGLSWTKFLVVVTIAFFCFGVPLMGFLVMLKERSERRKGRNQ